MAELLKEFEVSAIARDIIRHRCFVMLNLGWSPDCSSEMCVRSLDLWKALLGTVFGILCNYLHSSDTP
jgi:hypothetical protein